MAQQQPHDDLFEGPTMTFGEHLEELRVCLFKSIMGIVVGVMIGVFVANHVVRFFQSPLEKAMKIYYLGLAVGEMQKVYPDGVPPEIETNILERGLVPEPIPIDVGQLARTLAEYYPGAVNTENLTSFLFVPDDFVVVTKISSTDKFPEFLKLFAGGGKNTAARRLLELLSAEDRAQLQQFAEESPSPAVRKQVLAILNRLLDNDALHAADDFKIVYRDAKGETIPEPPLLRDAPTREQTRQRNKRALTAAFSSYIPAPGISTIPLWQWKAVRVRFQVLNAQESFMIWMKAALVTGVALASPWIFFQIWIFVASGLYRHEKNYVYIYLPFSVALFLAGASLAFFFVFEPVLTFLFGFQKEMNAEFEPRIGEWMSFVLIMPLGFGISFQLPLVMLFLNRIGLVEVDVYKTNWRIAILIIFVIAMILTPADPVSMLLMAVPLCFLYVLGIAMCYWMPKGRSPFQEAYEP